MQDDPAGRQAAASAHEDAWPERAPKRSTRRPSAQVEIHEIKSQLPLIPNAACNCSCGKVMPNIPQEYMSQVQEDTAKHFEDLVNLQRLEMPCLWRGNVCGQSEAHVSHQNEDALEDSDIERTCIE